MRTLILLSMLVTTLLLGACSDNNPAAPEDAPHPENWITAHPAAALANANYSDCVGCHGADLKGSGAAPSCFANNFEGTACHSSGPGALPHPMDGSFLNPANHGPVAKADLTCLPGLPRPGRGSWQQSALQYWYCRHQQHRPDRQPGPWL